MAGWTAGHVELLQRYPAPREVAMGWMICVYLLGMAAIFAGTATMVDSSIRSIDIVEGALVIGGLGSAAWATGGMSFFKMFIGVLLMTVLVGGVVEVLDLHLLASAS
jgi:hypothetical protein